MTNTPHDLLFLEPIFHEKLWGGRRLQTEFGYAIPDGPVGECWAISAHPAGDCRVTGGAFDGMPLSRLWDERRGLFGNLPGDRFPLLVKILDAEDGLSVQVHPDDAYAAEHENGSLGKRECWYVLSAGPDAQIIVGQKARGRNEFASMAAAGQWNQLLNRIPVRAGDFFQVEPGTMHAILGGTLILETQQSSDVTYRVYDWGRLQADGTPRELHMRQALDVIDFSAAPPASGKVTASEENGVTRLVSCPNFCVVRVRVRDDAPVSLAQTHPFMCVSVVEGSGSVVVDKGKGAETVGTDLVAAEKDSVAAGQGSATAASTRHDLSKGSHFLVPYGAGDLHFVGNMTVIASWVPAEGE